MFFDSVDKTVSGQCWELYRMDSGLIQLLKNINDNVVAAEKSEQAEALDRRPNIAKYFHHSPRVIYG